MKNLSEYIKEPLSESFHNMKLDLASIYAVGSLFSYHSDLNNIVNIVKNIYNDKNIRFKTVSLNLNKKINEIDPEILLNELKRYFDIDTHSYVVILSDKNYPNIYFTLVVNDSLSNKKSVELVDSFAEIIDILDGEWQSIDFNHYIWKN